MRIRLDGPNSAHQLPNCHHAEYWIPAWKDYGTVVIKVISVRIHDFWWILVRKTTRFLMTENLNILQVKTIKSCVPFQVRVLILNPGQNTTETGSKTLMDKPHGTIFAQTFLPSFLPDATNSKRNLLNEDAAIVVFFRENVRCLLKHGCTKWI